MKRGTQGRYTTELRAETVKHMTEGKLSVMEAGRHLSLPPSTLRKMTKMASIFCGLLLLCCLATDGLAGINDGLVAHYLLNVDATDSSGNGNHGSIIGALPCNDRLGNQNAAYCFDGTNDYIDTGNSSSLKPQLPISFSVWVKETSSDQANPIFNNNFTNNMYFGAGVVLSSSKVGIYYGDGRGTAPEYRRSKHSTTTLNVNQWYHIVGIIRGPQDMEIYINGVNDGGTYNGTGGPLAYNNDSGRIACNDSSGFNPPNYLNGSIDELRVYNRALSESEIQLLAEYSPPAVTAFNNIGFVIAAISLIGLGFFLMKTKIIVRSENSK